MIDMIPSLKLTVSTPLKMDGGRTILSFSKGLHSGRLTWNLKMMVWKMIFLSKWVIWRFHVNLPGCIFSGFCC